MLVYYTSNIEKLSPNVYQFREYRVFGRGFYIEGGVVDYQVFDIVDLYLKKEISREEAVSQLSSKTPNFHICINNQLIISRLLHPVKSVKLSKHHNLKHKFSAL